MCPDIHSQGRPIEQLEQTTILYVEFKINGSSASKVSDISTRESFIY